MTRDLSPLLIPSPPVIKTCGFCSEWKVPSSESSAFPRADEGMRAQGMRPCAISGQSWRYFGASHRCHLSQQ